MNVIPASRLEYLTWDLFLFFLSVASLHFLFRAPHDLRTHGGDAYLMSSFLLLLALRVFALYTRRPECNKQDLQHSLTQVVFAFLFHISSGGQKLHKV